MSRLTSIYVLYETTCKINGRYYVGVHKQKKTNFDGYLGSGKILKLSISKYGKSLFMRETLGIFKSAEEAYAKEREIVNESFVDNPNSYNLKIGGEGGWDHAKNFSPETKKKMLVKFNRKGMATSDKTKKLLSEACKKNNGVEKLHKLITCPHCKKQSTIGTMKRWHFDNCKLNPAHPAT